MAWVYLFASLLSAPLWGWALSLGWGWFFQPLFGGPSVNWQQGTGLLLIWGLVEYKLGRRNFDDGEYAYRCAETFLAPLWIIGIFWSFAKLVIGVA